MIREAGFRSGNRRLQTLGHVTLGFAAVAQRTPQTVDYTSHDHVRAPASSPAYASRAVIHGSARIRLSECELYKVLWDE